jgi:hypothetical protein
VSDASHAGLAEIENEDDRFPRGRFLRLPGFSPGILKLEWWGGATEQRVRLARDAVASLTSLLGGRRHGPRPLGYDLPHRIYLHNASRMTAAVDRRINRGPVE